MWDLIADQEAFQSPLHSGGINNTASIWRMFYMWRSTMRPEVTRGHQRSSPPAPTPGQQRYPPGAALPRWGAPAWRSWAWSPGLWLGPPGPTWRGGPAWSPGPWLGPPGPTWRGGSSLRSASAPVFAVASNAVQNSHSEEKRFQLSLETLRIHYLMYEFEIQL